MDKNTGAVKFNFKPEHGITNGASVNGKRAFLANCEDGISVMEKSGNGQFRELGTLDFNGPYSSNMVLSDACFVFAAKGLGGLKIMLIVENDPNSACYCASPVPSATPEPPVTPTPSCTPTPEDTPTPSCTPTPEDVPTPSCTPTPEVSNDKGKVKNNNGLGDQKDADNTVKFDDTSNPGARQRRTEAAK